MFPNQQFPHSFTAKAPYQWGNISTGLGAAAQVAKTNNNPIKNVQSAPVKADVQGIQNAFSKIGQEIKKAQDKKNLNAQNTHIRSQTEKQAAPTRGRQFRFLGPVRKKSARRSTVHKPAKRSKQKQASDAQITYELLRKYLPKTPNAYLNFKQASAQYDSIHRVNYVPGAQNSPVSGISRFQTTGAQRNHVDHMSGAHINHVSGSHINPVSGSPLFQTAGSPLFQTAGSKQASESSPPEKSAFLKLASERGLNEFQQSFFSRCLELNLSGDEVRSAVEKAAADFGEEVGTELRAGFEKVAVSWGNVWKGIRNFGSGAAKAFNTAKTTVAPYAAPLGRAAAGGFTGSQMAEVNSDSSVDNWMGGLTGAAYGMLMGKNAPTPMKNMGMRAFAGSGTGYALGDAGDTLGILPEGAGNRGAQIGGWAGFLSGAVPHGKTTEAIKKRIDDAYGVDVSGAVNAKKRVDNAIAATGNVLSKPYNDPANWGGMNLWHGAKQVFDNTNPLSKRIGYGLAAVPTVGFAGAYAKDKAVSTVMDYMKAPENREQLLGTFDQMAKEELGVGLNELREMMAQGKASQGMMSSITGIVDQVLGMIGIDGSTMDPSTKLMLLLGGGMLMGGTLGGSTAMQGLGGLALGAGMLGGFGSRPGAGSGAPATMPRAPAPQAQAAPAPETPQISQAIPEQASLQPRNELAVQQNMNHQNFAMS